MEPQPQDYYKLLKLKPGASEDEVQEAYRKMAKQWHPDRFVKKSEKERKAAQEKMLALNRAYEYLKKNKPAYTRPEVAFQYRYRRYAGAGMPSTTLRIQTDKPKRRFAWGWARRAVLAALIVYVIFGEGAAPLRAEAAAIWKDVTSAFGPRVKPRAPAQAPAPAPAAPAPQSAPRPAVHGQPPAPGQPGQPGQPVQPRPGQPGSYAAPSGSPDYGFGSGTTQPRRRFFKRMPPPPDAEPDGQKPRRR